MIDELYCSHCGERSLIMEFEVDCPLCFKPIRKKDIRKRGYMLQSVVDEMEKEKKKKGKGKK